MMKNYLYSISVVFFITGILGYISGLALCSKGLKKAIVNLWEKTSIKKETNLKKDILRTTKNLLVSIYEKNGRISPLKLFLIALILNISIVQGIFLIELKTPLSSLTQLDQNSPQFVTSYVLPLRNDLIKIVFIMIISVFFTEIISYKTTKYFIDKALNKKSYIPILHDILLVIFGFYLIPFLYSRLLLFFSGFKELFGWAGPFMLFLTPMMQVTMWFEAENQMLFFNIHKLHWYLMGIAVFSICLPTLLVMLGISLFYNKRLLGIITNSIELIDPINPKLIANVSLAVIAIASGAVTIISFKP